MPSIETDRVRMAEANRVFDQLVTPLLRPIIMTIPHTDARQAWWDGFLASVVGAMTATMGEARTRQSCFDLWVRAKEWEAEQAKMQAVVGHE